MDILFLAHRLPYPPNKGDKIRSHALLTHLASRHRVHLAAFVDDGADCAYLDDVGRIAGGECLFVRLNAIGKWLNAARAFPCRMPITTAYFGSRAIEHWVQRIVRQHAITHAVVFSSAMAPFLLKCRDFPPTRAILDMVDIDSAKWAQYAAASGGFKNWIFRREARLLFELERKAAQAFGATVLVSEREAQEFASLAPESRERICAIGNGVDLERFRPGNFPNPFAAGEIPIVMTGYMDYRPNVDGARWFAKEVLPIVLKAAPAARFHIVGANPAAALRALRGAHVALTGHVQDVRPYLQHAAVVVAPLRMGRGVQNKVIEAMAMAKPLVATRESTLSLPVSNGVELRIENDPGAFADATVALLRHEGLPEMAERARAYVEAHHDWRKNLLLLDGLFDRLAGRPEERSRPLASPSPADAFLGAPASLPARGAAG